MKVRTFAIVFLVLAVVVLSAAGLRALSRDHREALPAGTSADRIVIDKSDRTLKAFARGRELKTYRIALGRNPEGAKQQQGDGRTPEGKYRIDFRKRDSAFHRALHITYPTPAQREAARRRGVSAGGDIMIHGLPNGMDSLGALHLARDWTEGCIAVTNEEIEELWRIVPNGTIVEINP